MSKKNKQVKRQVKSVSKPTTKNSESDIAQGGLDVIKEGAKIAKETFGEITDTMFGDGKNAKRK